MTCQELRAYFEDPLRMDAAFSAEAEHLVSCPECARFVVARRELGAGLRVIRESVPQLPAALDACVLADYRHEIAGRAPRVNSIPRRRRMAIACWSGAAAALMLAAALSFHSGRRSDNSTVQVRSARPLPAPDPITPTKTANIVRLAKPIGSLSARHHRQARSAKAVESPALADFRSLMYCDELSCGGAMQLIRVQLASSAVAFASAGATTSGVIYADVVVGPDGIARGIRVIE
jgi:hypothetical protein